MPEIRGVKDGVESAYLDGDLRVVIGRAVPIVVHVFVPRVVRECAECGAVGQVVLRGQDVEVAQHAHLHVLGGLLVAVVHEGARRLEIIEIGDAVVLRDAEGGHGLPVEDRGRVGEPVEVDRMRIEEVRPQCHADVAQREVQMLALLRPNRRSRELRAEPPVGPDQRGVGIRDLESEGIHVRAVGHLDDAVPAGDGIADCLGVRGARTLGREAFGRRRVQKRTPAPGQVIRPHRRGGQKEPRK